MLDQDISIHTLYVITLDLLHLLNFQVSPRVCSFILLIYPLVSHDSVRLISCGADKSLVIQEVKEGIARRINQVVGKATMYDMLVDPVMKFIATVGQDKILRCVYIRHVTDVCIM